MGRARQIGVEQNAAAKRHTSLTLVCDLEQGTVAHRSEARAGGGVVDQTPLGHYYHLFSAQEHHYSQQGLNSTIQTIKKMAYGFWNKDHFKTAIFFHCGGLDLYPC